MYIDNLLYGVAFDSMVKVSDHRINGHPTILEPPWVVLVKKRNIPSASFKATSNLSGAPLGAADRSYQVHYLPALLKLPGR